jgi:hypothetical protein
MCKINQSNLLNVDSIQKCTTTSLLCKNKKTILSKIKIHQTNNFAKRWHLCLCRNSMKTCLLLVFDPNFFFKERISQLLFSRGHLTATEQRLCGITISVISIAFVYKCTVISRKKIFSRTKKDPVSDFMYCLQT